MPRPRKRTSTPLSEFLDGLLARRDLGHNEFSALVGETPSSVADRKLKRDDLTDREDEERADRWAKALGLSRAEKRLLYELLQMSRLPPLAREVFGERWPGRSELRVADDRPEGDPRGRDR